MSYYNPNDYMGSNAHASTAPGGNMGSAPSAGMYRQDPLQFQDFSSNYGVCKCTFLWKEYDICLCICVRGASRPHKSLPCTGRFLSYELKMFCGTI